ncbi:MAG: hypothetical protein MK101_11665 [Phycisphaerales bacterium]|nr:hypothetical protein [Phycisphaerales bacterium]
MRWVLGVSALFMCLAGCAAPGGPGVWQGPGQGMEVNIYLRGPHSKYARWAAGPGNELRFAGGFNAATANWTWTGALTDEQVAQLDALVANADWLHQVPVGDGLSGNVWEVTVASPSGRNSFTVEGHEASVAKVWALLEQAGRARFAQDEHLVPKGDLDSYIQERDGQTGSPKE